LISGFVNKILPFSSVDGPGNRTVIFFQGCNFNCLYCHNPETINLCNNCKICIKDCPSGALSFGINKVLFENLKCSECDNCIKTCSFFSSPKVKILNVDEIFEIVEKTKLFTSGITISGGECTNQLEFLKEILLRAKSLGISSFIDTNAFLEFEKMKELSNYFDKAMIDLKWFDDETHIQLSGKSNKLVLQNTDYLISQNKVHEIRTVIFPFIGDNSENIRKISEFIAGRDENLTFKLIKFRKNGVKNTEKYTEPTDEFMLELQNIAFKNDCKNVVII
jgi:YjjW family glycine radical enzyme activase